MTDGGGNFLPRPPGDKTMLATATIAGRQHSFVGVWLGSGPGMVVADGPASIVGKVKGLVWGFY